MSEAEIIDLLERARVQYDNYLVISQASRLLREQCEFTCAPIVEVNDEPIGLVITNGAHGLVV